MLACVALTWQLQVISGTDGQVVQVCGLEADKADGARVDM